MSLASIAFEESRAERLMWKRLFSFSHLIPDPDNPGESRTSIQTDYSFPKNRFDEALAKWRINNGKATVPYKVWHTLRMIYDDDYKRINHIKRRTQSKAVSKANCKPAPPKISPTNVIQPVAVRQTMSALAPRFVARPKHLADRIVSGISRAGFTKVRTGEWVKYRNGRLCRTLMTAVHTTSADLFWVISSEIVTTPTPPEPPSSAPS